jgi:hypothetical protein
MDPEDDPITVLGLSQLHLERRLAAAEACAVYHRTAYGSHLYGATMAVFTASCWTLIDARASQQWWWDAREQYADLGHPYADLLAVCAGMTELNLTEIRSPQSALSVQCRTLLLAWLSLVEPKHASHRNELLECSEMSAVNLAAARPGQLNLPTYHVQNFARLLYEDFRQQNLSDRTIDIARHLLRCAADKVRTAQADRYHWYRILPGFMPIEPEWLAVGRIVYEAANRTDVDFNAAMRYLDPLERIPLVLAGRMPPPAREGRTGTEPRSPTEGGRSTSHHNRPSHHDRNLDWSNQL